MNSREIINKTQISSNVARTCVFALTLLAAVLRFLYLEYPIGWDEKIVLTWVEHMSLPDLLGYYRNIGNHFFHTLLMYLSVHTFGSSFWAFRLPTYVAGVLLVPATYYSLSRITNRNIALYCSAIVATSSLLILTSVNARGYIIQTLLVVLLVPTTLELIKNLTVRNVLLFAGVLSLAQYTLPTTTAVAPGFCIWGLLYGTFHRQHSSGFYTSLRNGFMGVTVAVLLTALLYAWPIYSTGLDQVGGGVKSMEPKSVAAIWQNALLMLSEVCQEFHWDIPPVGIIISYVLALLGTAYLLFVYPLTFLLVVLVPASTIGMMLLFGFAGVNRLFLYAFPFYALLPAAGIHYIISIFSLFVREQARTVLTLTAVTVLSAALSLYALQGEMIALAPGYARPQGVEEFVKDFSENVLQDGDYVVNMYPQIQYWIDQDTANKSKWRKFHPVIFNRDKGQRFFLIVRHRRETLEQSIAVRIPAETDFSRFSSPTLAGTYGDLSIYRFDLLPAESTSGNGELQPGN